MALEAQLDARDPEIDIERCPKSAIGAHGDASPWPSWPKPGASGTDPLVRRQPGRARYFVRELAIEHANVEAAKGMADQ